jgi:LysM repeat protein
MAQQIECANCGARLSADDWSCPVCGLAVRDGRDQRVCPNCGAPVAQRAHTCLMCQAPLDRVPVRGILGGVSWIWIVAVAALAALIGLSWNWWRTWPPAQPASAVGASVLTPTPYVLFTPTVAPATSTSTPTSGPATPIVTPTPLIHVVKSGETLLAIALYYGTDLQTLMRANGMNEESARRLRVGQELVIPEVGPARSGVPDENAPPPQIIHVVQAGDTLISIAIKYGADLDAIMAANPKINPDLIYVGQEIVVPLRPPTATPTLTLTPTPTDTPSPPYSAPVLLYPVNGQMFEGSNAVVVLSWTSVGILSKEQAYLVELEVPGLSSPVRYTTQGTSWRLSADLWPTGAGRTFLWRVIVVEQLPASSGGPASWTPISPPAEARQFDWH